MVVPKQDHVTANHREPQMTTTHTCYACGREYPQTVTQVLARIEELGEGAAAVDLEWLNAWTAREHPTCI